MRRTAFRLVSFCVLGLTAALAACGGGGSAGPVTPLPTGTPDARAAGLVDGATASYDRVTQSTITYVPVSPGIPVGPAPSPVPTTTTVAQTYRDTVTVAGNQSFGGASGLFDVRTSTVPTGQSASRFSAYTDVTDAYEGLAGGALLEYGSTSKIAYTDTFVGYVSSATATTTDTIPRLLVPLAPGAVGDPAVAYASASTTQFSEPSPSPGVVFGPAGGSGTTSVTATLGADGAFHLTQTGTDGNGTTGSITENVAGPGLAGSVTYAHTDSGGGTSSTTYTVGAPAQTAGGYAYAYAISATGSGPQPKPTATTVPLWYPDGPAQRPVTLHVADHGQQTVLASCALPAGLPGAGEATETVTTAVSAFTGSVDRVDETRWDAPAVGTLCSVAVETFTGYDPATGVKLTSATQTTTRALRASAVPAALRRSAGLAAPAMPFVLPQAQPSLPRLVAALRRHARERR